MFGGDPNLYIWVSNFGPSPQEIGSQKTSKFGANFGHLHNLIAYISGTNISEQKTALQTAIFPAHADLIG